MRDKQPSVILVLGQAGAGHSTAVKILEDEGFMSVDNMPLALVDQLVALEVETEGNDLVFCVDARTSGFDIQALQRLIENLRQKFDTAFKVVHLSATPLEILRRFQSTRRNHPLAGEHQLEEAIALDYERMSELRTLADVTINSTATSPNALRRALLNGLEIEQVNSAQIRVLSFAYKEGLPEGADYVFDMRFLRNPHWAPDLREMTGEAEEVANYVAADEHFESFCRDLKRLSVPIFKGALRDNRPQITFAFGCTGGKHRSVAMAVYFAAWAKAEGHNVSILHRELQKIQAQES